MILVTTKFPTVKTQRILTLLIFGVVCLSSAVVKAQTTPEDKAKREEIERKNAEIAAKNREITAFNEKITRVFRAANEAYGAKNYTEAIRFYDEGISLDAEQFVFYQNKAIALKMRGVSTYNNAIRSKDAGAIKVGREAGRKDLSDAAASMNRAYQLSKAQPSVTVETRLNIIKERADIVRILVKLDPTQAEAGAAAFQDYASMETDPDLKLMSQTDAVQLLFNAGSIERALAESRKILAVNPDNLDANLYAGLSIVSLGDDSRYREGMKFFAALYRSCPRHA